METTKPEKPRIAPELVIDRWLQGKPVTITSLRGKVVVLYFWGAWPSDESTVLELVSLDKEYKNRGLAVISVLLPPFDETYMRKVILEKHVEYPIGVDPGAGRESKNLYAYDQTSRQLLFLIDRKGMAIGFKDASALRSAIEAALGVKRNA